MLYNYYEEEYKRTFHIKNTKTKGTLMKKRILSILLIAVMLLPLAACNDQPPVGPNGTDVTTTGSDVPPEPVETLSLIVAGASGYTVTRPDNTSETVLQACRDLISAVKAKTGTSLGFSSDWLKPGESAPELELLIGDTARDESQAELEGLKAAGFSVKIVGKKLVIVGGSDDATADGVHWFINNLIEKLPDGATDITLSSDTTNYLYSEDYRIRSVDILGTPLSEYKIVLPVKYNASEYRTYVFLKDHLKRNAGVDLELIYDRDTAEHEILIGRTKRSTDLPTGQNYSVKASGNSLQLAGASMFAYEYLQTYLLNDLFATSIKDISIAEGFTYSNDVSSTLEDGAENVLSRSGEIRVMFNNMYGSSQSIHPRPQRQQQLGELYEAYLPDVIGLQECNPNSRGGDRGIDTILRGLGYTDAVSSSTNYTPIFYRADKLELVESNYKQYADGKGDRSKGYTWCVFRVKATGKLFAALSTHYWYKNVDATDNEARLTDATEMMGAVSAIVKKYGCAVITGGDFNCNKGSAPYGQIIADGYTDAYKAAEKSEQVKSHHAYPTYDEELKLYGRPVMPDTKIASSIDHILIKNADQLDIKLFDVVTDLYSLLSTDHCPIYIDINIK